MQYLCRKNEIAHFNLSLGLECRRKLLYEVDPVNTLKLSSFLKAKMQQCGAVHGDSFQAAFQRLDPSVSDQLKLAIK